MKTELCYLMAITEAKDITLYVPATPRVTTRIDFSMTDLAVLDDIIAMYGSYEVERVAPRHMDETLAIWIRRAS